MPRPDGADGVGYGVMSMDDLNLMIPDNLDQFVHKAQIMRRIAKERIIRDENLVKCNFRFFCSSSFAGL
jgi:hypothetical protein